jgi:hypothetical protein
MKKSLFITAILLISLPTIAQENNPSNEKTISKDKILSNHELKLNALYLIIGIPEFGYEYLINEESGIGLNILLSIDSDIDFNFALTPYYRFYFGKKRAAGFFAEGFGMLNSYDSTDYDGQFDAESETDFALGIGVGAKFLTNGGFIFEIYGGVGRNLITQNYYSEEFVPRFGITLGKRF